MIYYELPTELISRSCEVQQVIHQLKRHSCSEVVCSNHILYKQCTLSELQLNHINQSESICYLYFFHREMRLAQVAVQPQLAKLSKYEVSEGMFIFFGHSQRGKVKSLTICLAAVGHQACSFVE